MPVHRINVLSFKQCLPSYTYEKRYSSANAPSGWALFDSLAAGHRPAHWKDKDLDYTCTEETRMTSLARGGFGRRNPSGLRHHCNYRNFQWNFQSQQHLMGTPYRVLISQHHIFRKTGKARTKGKTGVVAYVGGVQTFHANTVIRLSQAIDWLMLLLLLCEKSSSSFATRIV